MITKTELKNMSYILWLGFILGIYDIFLTSIKFWLIALPVFILVELYRPETKEEVKKDEQTKK